MRPAHHFRPGVLLDALPPMPRLSGSGPYAGALDLLVAPAEWVLAATGRVLCAAAKELHRAYRARRGEEIASVLGTPTATEIAAAWTPAPRSVRQALVIGAKLVDLSATHPIEAVRTRDGKARGRSGGLKPFFAESLPDIPYSTAIRYRLLARRLRQALEIPLAIPLEWLLCDDSPAVLTQDSALLPLIPALRRRVAGFLGPFRSQAALSRALAKKLGIAPCPFSRRSARRTPAQRARDLAEDSARLEGYVATLFAKCRNGVPLSPPERRALGYLRAIGMEEGRQDRLVRDVEGEKTDFQ
ncbi:MAG: hypothetical protein IK066_02710 [Kiritimatiellae bacterium]|nr:hypothetical protein [Kiritimatiellia bacterium]